MSHPAVLACRLATDQATNSSMKLIECMAQLDFELTDHIALCRDAINHSRELLTTLNGTKSPGDRAGAEPSMIPNFRP